MKGGGIIFKPKLFLTVLLCVLLLSGCNRQNNSGATPSKDITVEIASGSATPGTGQTPAPVQFKNDEYTISIDIDPVTRIVTGVEKVSYQNRAAEPIDSIYFNLYLNAFSKDNSYKPYFGQFESKIFQSGKDYAEMKIISATANGDSLAFSIKDTILEVKLDEPLGIAAEIEITLVFEAYIPKINNRTGANDYAMWFGNFFPVVCVYDHNGWHTEPYYPAGSPFFSNISNYTVRIVTPAGYRIVATGQEKAVESGGKKTTTVTSKLIRDFAFAISDKYQVDTLKTDRGVYINIYHYSDLASPAALMETAKQSLEYYGGVFGDYPYFAFDIAETGMPSESAASYPMLAFMDSALLRSNAVKSAVTREVAKQYLFNIVVSDSINEAWLSEGLTAYFHLAYSYSGDEFGKRLSAEYELLKPRLATNGGKLISQDLSIYTDYDSYIDMQQSKAKLMIFALRNKMGDIKFGEFIKAYYTKFLYSTAYSSDFIKTAEEIYGGPLTDFFDGWLYSDDLQPLFVVNTSTRP